MRYLRCSLLVSVCFLAAEPVMAAPPEVCGNQLDVGRHRCVEDFNPLESCQAILAGEPKRLTATIALCDLAVADGDFDRADALLDEANRVHRADNYALNLLRIARSNVAESRRTGPTTRGDVDVLAEYLDIRCESLNNLDACAELVGLRPEDPKPLNRLGQAALSDGEYVWAIRYLERSLALDGSQADVVQNLAKARSGRQEQVQRCLGTSGSRAIEACLDGRMPGGADESDILVRLGDLSVEQRLLADAREYYREAAALPGRGAAAGRLELLDLGNRCLGRGQPADCEAALARIPAGGQFLDLRNQLSRQRCLLTIESGGLAEATSRCEQAIAHDPKVRIELNRLLGTKALGECQSRYSNGQGEAAVVACAVAKDLLTEPALIAMVDKVIEELRADEAPGAKEDPVGIGAREAEEVVAASAASERMAEVPPPAPSPAETGEAVVLVVESNEPEFEGYGAVVTY